jgi:diguanylate cyclase (GGDEF)-like protein
LSRFGAIVRDALRGVDIAGRWGGDEFLVIFPHTTASGAAVPVERLRHGIRRAEFANPEGKRFLVTCSFGVAEYRPGNATAADLLEAADRSLYRAKRAGRDRVVLASASGG